MKAGQITRRGLLRMLGAVAASPAVAPLARIIEPPMKSDYVIHTFFVDDLLLEGAPFISADLRECSRSMAYNLALTIDDLARTYYDPLRTGWKLEDQV